MSSPAAQATATSPAAHPPKRGRKARPSFTDDDKQRERKRAMDRKAQRVSREKTRSHIAHLEKMVGILCEKNESEATTELMAEVSRLNAEIERLRKIIETIRSVLRADSFEMESQGQRNNANGNGSRSGSKEPATKQKGFTKSENVEPSQSSQPIPQQQPHYHPVFDELEEFSISHTQNQPASQVSPPSLPIIEEARSPPVQQPLPSAPPLNFTPAWSAAVIPRRRPAHSRSHSVSTIPSLPSQLWAQLYPSIPPSISSLPVPPPASSLPCRIWTKSNRIYAKMFDIKVHASDAADQIRTGMLFKAVKEGWTALGDEMNSNPVLSVLRMIDQEVFPKLDRVTRVALMHKSHLLMKYFLHSDEKNWASMPQWQRPVPSQSALQHPIAIDFFAWPSLRDRLVSQHTSYFATPPSDPSSKAGAGIAAFSAAYQRHFRFSWPFTFDDSYTLTSDGEYMISPLFSRYHSDIGYWGVEKEFFEKFPEFKGVMSEAHVYEPRDGEGGIWNYDGRGGEVRSVSPTSNSSTSSPRDRVQEVLPDTTTEAQMRSSVSVTNSGSTNSTAPSPEEVALGTLDAEGDMDVDMLGTQPMTENVKAEEANNVHAVHALQFDFPPQERGPALGVGYETADAYMMELFNDLPCC